jgi:hypothetical protein
MSCCRFHRSWTVLATVKSQAVNKKNNVDWIKQLIKVTGSGSTAMMCWFWWERASVSVKILMQAINFLLPPQWRLRFSPLPFLKCTRAALIQINLFQQLFSVILYASDNLEKCFLESRPTVILQSVFSLYS